MLPVNILQSLIARTRNDLRHQHKRLAYHRSCLKELCKQVSMYEADEMQFMARSSKHLLEFSKERVSTLSKKIKKLVECQKALKKEICKQVESSRMFYFN